MRFGVTYCESVFRKSSNENVEVFLLKGPNGTTLTSCRYMRIGAFCALILHIYYGVGYCVGYLQQGLSTTFIWINESQLHTFFLLTLHAFGARSIITILDFYESLDDWFEENNGILINVVRYIIVGYDDRMFVLEA